MKRLETLCISWEDDLLAHLDAARGVRLHDLLYVSPPWESGRAGWTGRTVSSIWLGRYGEAEVTVFVDEDGIEFCTGLIEAQPQDVKDRRLIAEAVPQQRLHA